MTRSPSTVRHTLPRAALLSFALLGVAVAGPDRDAVAQTSIVIREVFSAGAANLDPILGGTWRASGGVYNLSRPAQPDDLTTGNANISLHRTALEGDWDFSARAKVTGTSSRFNDVSLIFGFADDRNYSYASFNETNDVTTSGLFTIVHGRRTQVADFSDVIRSGRYYSLRVTHAAGLVTAFVDGGSVGQARMTIDGGSVGLGSRDDACAFDDLVATAVIPDPSPTVVSVASSSQLSAALAGARPGEVIQLADGTYKGRFVIGRSGTPAAPITLRGSRNAVLDGGSLTTGYGLHVKRVSDWRLEGFTVSNILKGIIVDGTTRLEIDRIEVRQIGAEGIHLRAFSSDNVIRNSVVRQTGLSNPGNGEGIYIGSASSNWGQHSRGQPDRSDRNQILDTSIVDTRGESIDIKEGSTGGVVRGNTFDGSAMANDHFADSWIDVKGNGYLIEGNRGRNAYTDGYQTHVQLDGWGQDTVFRGNTAIVNGPGYGFNISQAGRATVGCDNVVQAAEQGFANIGCTRSPAGSDTAVKAPPGRERA